MVHLSRSEAPEWWPIKRKGYRWAIKPSPGPHSADRSMPLAAVIRDVLGYAKTLKEARFIIGQGQVKVDGVVRRDYKYPVGLMDVVEIVPTGEAYRVVPDNVKFLKLIKIDKSEAKLKICRIENKTAVKGGLIQLNLHDGRNYVVNQDEASKYETLGSVLIDLEEGKILDYVPMQPGVYVMAFDGNNVGMHGVLQGWIRTFRRRDAIATVKSGDVEFRTILKYLIPVGREKPLIKVAE